VSTLLLPVHSCNTLGTIKHGPLISTLLLPVLEQTPYSTVRHAIESTTPQQMMQAST
jgi:hypothetical protein